jgi:hypothetical protein
MHVPYCPIAARLFTQPPQPLTTANTASPRPPAAGHQNRSACRDRELGRLRPHDNHPVRHRRPPRTPPRVCTHAQAGQHPRTQKCRCWYVARAATGECLLLESAAGPEQKLTLTRRPSRSLVLRGTRSAFSARLVATSRDHGLVCRRRAVARGAEVLGAGDRMPALAHAAQRSAGRVAASGVGASAGRNCDPTNVSTTARLEAQTRASRDAPTLRVRTGSAERTDSGGVRLRPAREPECRRSDPPGKAVVCRQIPVANRHRYMGV